MEVLGIFADKSSEGDWHADMKGQIIEPQITCAANISCIHYTLEDGNFLYKSQSHIFNRLKVSPFTNYMNAFSKEESVLIDEGQIVCFASDITHKAGSNNHEFISSHGFERLQASVYTKTKYESNEVQLGKYEQINFVLR